MKLQFIRSLWTIAAVLLNGWAFDASAQGLHIPTPTPIPIREVDRVVLSGNPGPDGVGDIAANLLLLKEIVASAPKDQSIVLIVNREAESYWVKRKLQEWFAELKEKYGPETEPQPEGIIRMQNKFRSEYRSSPEDSYKKTYDFLGLDLQKASGTLEISGRKIEWFDEEQAYLNGILGKVGIVASIYPNTDSRAVEVNGDFFYKMKQFALDWIASEDYTEEEQRIWRVFEPGLQPLAQKRLDRQKEVEHVYYGQGVRISSGASSGPFYFFKAPASLLSQPAAATHRILINPTGHLEYVGKESLDALLKFAQNEFQDKPVEYWVVSDEDQQFLSQKVPADQIKLFKKKPFLEFTETLGDFDAVFSGGLTLGTYAWSLGIPAFFQSREQLNFAVENHRRYFSAILGAATGAPTDATVGKQLLALGRKEVLKRIETVPQDKSIFATVASLNQLAQIDTRPLPLILKAVTRVSPTWHPEKVVHFLSMECNGILRKKEDYGYPDIEDLIEEIGLKNDQAKVIAFKHMPNWARIQFIESVRQASFTPGFAYEKLLELIQPSK